ncbi:hypothetical protein F4781DRAFT_444837 [Annulohypoxylon bovei var. microspora]|nr:hypothetical protein F4781DRAFT_444837 [Annulohypoxylon bovei var. microspora]
MPPYAYVRTCPYVHSTGNSEAARSIRSKVGYLTVGFATTSIITVSIYLMYRTKPAEWLLILGLTFISFATILGVFWVLTSCAAYKKRCRARMQAADAAHRNAHRDAENPPIELETLSNTTSSTETTEAPEAPERAHVSRKTRVATVEDDVEELHSISIE